MSFYLRIMAWVAILSLLIGYTLYFMHKNKVSDDKRYIIINDYRLTTEIARTPDQRMRGLSFSKPLSENQAMLFIFETDAPHAFWMKDMLFPIDIIWLDAKLRAVYIEHNVSPCHKNAVCPMYKPSVNARYVLETIAGFANQHHITQNITQVTFAP